MAPESALKQRIDDAGPSMPQMVIVCGHPRSGTSMLRRLLNTHPTVMITMEFRNFTRLGSPPSRYLGGIRWRKWRRELVQLTHGAPGWRHFLDGLIFRLAYALSIRIRCRGKVSLRCIHATLHSILPWAKVVGDKYPGYIYRLDRMAARPDVRCIVIYRDCRDVVSSTLTMAATAWKNSHFVTAMDTPAKVAARWVKAIAHQERNAGAVLAIRYEDLVTQPGPVVARIGQFLNIDPAGFRLDLVRPTSIGKHRGKLSTEALEEVEAIAGDTMRRLGYI
jgi:hypothetical protein